MPLRILHVSDDPLPDARVEKMAYLSKRKGWETFFAGPACNGFALGENVFDSVSLIFLSRHQRLGMRLGFLPYFQWVKRKLKKAISLVRPDIIHAHNVFSAKMACDSGYSFVFDDHEFFSLEKRSDTETGDLSDRTVGKYESWLWSRWEHDVSSEAPVITVSDGIADAYKNLGANVFVVPNYPSIYESSKAYFPEEKNHAFTAVYLGDDISTCRRPYRDMRGVINVFKELASINLVVIGDKNLHSEDPISSTGYIHHLKLYDVMSRFHVGLLPWKRHWFHEFANPNKPYMYAHASLAVIVTSSLQNVVKAFEGRARTIDDFSELKDVLLEFSQNVEATIKEGKNNKRYASDNFVFERYESKVMEAYKKAV